MPAIEVRNLQKTFLTKRKAAGMIGSLRALVRPEYSSVEAVRWLTFKMEPGELLGFIDPIGAGKSTTIKMLTGILHPTGGPINTAYIERLNATFRACIAALARRGRALARQTTTLHRSMYLVGCIYNFCTYHRSLRVAIPLPGGRRHWVSRTSALAAGITDHCWTVEELLSFRLCAIAALDSTETTWSALQGDKSPPGSMVLMTTVKCGATLLDTAAKNRRLGCRHSVSPSPATVESPLQ